MRIRSTKPEFWKIITGTDYAVSSQGRVRSPTRRILKPFVADRAGHLAVHLPTGRVYVHRLVAAAFLGEPRDGEEVRHLDNTPANNAAKNLAWGTRSQNVLDLRSVRTHCPQGHEFTPANTRIQTNGWRRCRACKKAAR